jgi:hypothetical protein
MTHHPHIHMIVPGGCISLDGERWVSSRARFLLPVRVLAKLFGGCSSTTSSGCMPQVISCSSVTASA